MDRIWTKSSRFRPKAYHTKIETLLYIKRLWIARRSFSVTCHLYLTDDIDEYLFDAEQSMKLIAQHGNDKDSVPLSLNIYEQLLKAASSNPKKFIEIEDVIRKIGKEEYTQEFLEIYKTFKEAIKQK